VVSITSGVSSANRFRNAYQEIDQQAVMRPLTKWVGYVTEPARAPDMLHRAVIEAMSGTPGPTHLDVASNFISGEFPGTVQQPPSPRHMRLPVQRPPAPEEEVAAAAELLNTAERPLILAGGGVILSRAWEALSVFAKAQGIPVVTSMAGKGSICETDPLSVGTCGVYSRRVANEIVAEADVLLAIGTQLGQMPTDVFKLPLPTTRLIHVDLDATKLNRNFAASLSVVADARAFLEQVLAQPGSVASPQGRRSWCGSVAQRVSAWRDKFETLAAVETIENKINPRFVMATLNRFIDADHIVVADTGYSAAWAGTMIEMKTAGQTYIRAAGSLGWALPGAIGVKLASPTRDVICLTGDGGIGYHISDIETAVRIGTPMTIVLLDNSTLGFEYTVQKLYYKQVSQAAHGFGPIDYAAVARGFGAQAVRVTSPDRLMPALEHARSCGKVCLIDVVTSPEIGAPYTRYENVAGEREL
jgi:acetolactate synthase-1/2/3 large subunit